VLRNADGSVWVLFVDSPAAAPTVRGGYRRVEVPMRGSILEPHWLDYLYEYLDALDEWCENEESERLTVHRPGASTEEERTRRVTVGDAQRRVEQALWRLGENGSLSPAGQLKLQGDVEPRREYASKSRR
jgi:hypothetical protein